MSTILTLENLSKKFGRLKAVDQLSFAVKKGFVYGILGPNGSGKSTTLGMVLNVINPTSGEFSWFEGSLNPHQALKKIGAIIERPNFYPYMTAFENLKLVCRIKQISFEAIEESLELVGLKDRQHDKFSTFSLGMKQRLAIGSALLNKPEILILDEPTNGLDPQGIFQIRELIKKIAQQGTTILLASHLLDEVEKVCSHVIVLQKGVACYVGPVADMSVDFGQIWIQSENLLVLKKTLQNHPEIAEIQEVNGYLVLNLKSTLATSALNKWLGTKKIYPSYLAFRKKSLEEKFLDLTASKNIN